MGALRRLPGMVTVSLCASLGGTAWATDPVAIAAAFMKGGEFCFDMTAPQEEGFVHLMLAVEPAGDAMAKVHAIQRGNVGAPKYSNQLSGTATIAPSNDAGSESPTLYVSLVGSGVGIGQDGAAEHWTFSYNLALDPATLAGKIYGAEIQSGPISDGPPFTIKATLAVLADAKPIPCADY
jgi:hypothetical protein